MRKKKKGYVKDKEQKETYSIWETENIKQETRKGRSVAAQMTETLNRLNRKRLCWDNRARLTARSFRASDNLEKLGAKAEEFIKEK